ncbi:hypothetical protein THAOC_04497 [Thalassiosira oceanica]|uniref:BTB domain-containing protein n=1 Tax=Thalassiosira oceanica TaxID=159749 RepID=K0T8E8_THAOC|nr:hypothetical protein THAOC_04497 [Thalassiosira oceanica]|eukprot:EJK73860.1 hypothetical protein THAOC_04497 [Thalassiosira oceanica]
MASAGNPQDGAGQSGPSAKRPRSSHLTLNVGGERFVTSASTLTSNSHYFTALLSGDWVESGDEELYIDQDPAAFKVLLGYMRRGLIKVDDVDEDVLLLAEYLGTERLISAVKVRWLVNLGRGPYLADDCSDEEIVAAFDEEYGGVSSAITAGLLQYFRKANDRVGKEYAEIDMRVTNGAVHCTAIQRFQGRDSIFTEGCSLVGAMNGLRARGYDSQPSSTTSHLHLIRRQYAMLLPRAESVFIPSENDIMAKKKDKTKTQVAAVLFAEDSQEPVAVLAPTEFGSDGGTGSDHFNLTVIKPVCIHTWRKINGFDNLLIANEGENFAVLKATYFAGIEDMDIEGVAIDEISMARVYSRIVRRI